MNIKAFLRFVASIILVLAAGCAGMQQPAPPLTPADLAAVTNPPINVPPDPLDTLPPAVRQAYLNQSHKPVQSGFATFYPYGQYEEPTIRCAPGHITEIVLASDEKVMAATVGDSVRWMVVPEQNKIRIKACPQGCAMGVGAAAAQPAVAAAPTVYATNLIIDTDRRTYHIKLQAGPLARAMESFTFWYPVDIVAAETARAEAMRKAATQTAADPPAHLNFNYRITGPSVPWKPVQAFDDGSHEYLLFADTAALESDMPSLYVGQGQTQELVNYQVRQNYYIVDRLYADAALTQGAGSDRQTVRIEAIGDRSMDTYKDTPRPPGPGRAWMLATFTMLLGLGVGIYLTAEKPKPKYSGADLREPPGAGAWADKEAQASPTAALVAAMPSPVVAPRVTAFNAPVQQYQPAALPCTACEERQRLLAAAQGSAMTVPVAGANTLELNPTPVTIATRSGPPHAVLANSWIYAVLETGIKSDQPGDVIARVSQGVRDTVTQTEVLIPQGSKLHGAVSQSSALNLNNTSVTVNWDSLQLPNGVEIALPNLPSADTAGYPGLSDKVDRHLAQTWLPSILVSAIAVGSMLSTTSTYGSAQGYSATSEALGQFGSSLGSQSIGNLGMMFQQLRPSIEIRKGTIFRVLVTRDLRFDQPYDEAGR